MNATQYIIRATAFSILAIALAVIFNWVVDPYGIADAERVEGFNQYKTDINEHTRMLKKYQPQFASYDTLVVGNSRVEMALDPGHQCFDSAGMTAYNLGIPGATLQTQVGYALNVIYQQDIKYLFVGLDFTDFIYPSRRWAAADVPFFERTSGELEYLPSGQRNPDFHRVKFVDYLKALFSIDALVSSVQTIFGQGPYASDRTEAGFNPGNDFEGVVVVEGAHALFEQKMQELIPKYSRPWYLRDENGALPDAFAELEMFLDIAAQRNIQVYLFTSPLHDQFWELLENNGHMPLRRDWLASMARLLESKPDQAVEFWDFAGDSPYIHEPVPAPGVLSGPLRWFWEPAHYRHELGGLMLQTMLSSQCDREPVFGQKLF